MFACDPSDTTLAIDPIATDSGSKAPHLNTGELTDSAATSDAATDTTAAVAADVDVATTPSEPAETVEVGAHIKVTLLKPEVRRNDPSDTRVVVKDASGRQFDVAPNGRTFHDLFSLGKDKELDAEVTVAESLTAPGVVSFVKFRETIAASEQLARHDASVALIKKLPPTSVTAIVQRIGESWAELKVKVFEGELTGEVTGKLFVTELVGLTTTDRVDHFRSLKIGDKVQVSVASTNLDAEPPQVTFSERQAVIAKLREVKQGNATIGAKITHISEESFTLAVGASQFPGRLPKAGLTIKNSDTLKVGSTINVLIEEVAPDGRSVRCTKPQSKGPRVRPVKVTPPPTKKKK